MTPQALLPRILTIAIEAGGRILEVYESDRFDVSRKHDDSPLTRADLAAHHHIVEALGQLKVRYPVLSEEDAEIPYATRKTWDRYWLVDPLDGTKEFIKRGGDFTVNIALIDQGYPVLGVVHAPALEETYLAAEGAGAFRVDGNHLRSIRTRKFPARPSFVVSRSHRNPELEVFLAKAPPHEAISIGSSLKFCRIATGAADLYPRTGPTSEWDTAAGQCVAEQAGARVLRLPEQTRLGYNEKESLLNPLFAVVGDPSRDWSELLATIR